MQVSKKIVGLFLALFLTFNVGNIQAQKKHVSQPKAKPASNQSVQQNAQQMLIEGEKCFALTPSATRYSGAIH
jgi:hypothetical protein